VNDGDSGRATILVVDDYAELRSLLRLWLEARGYRVAEAADGREAVEVAERERPALILMDVAMPDVDGFTAALRIRRMEGLGGVPIVATSAYGDSAKAVQLKIDPTAVGFNAYLQKPFGPQQLDELLELFAPRRVVLAAGP
jgi:CheY-like chemotaxis protein